MGKELKSAEVIGTDDSDNGSVMVYCEYENEDQFALTTLVPKCALKPGDKLNVIVDPNRNIPIPGTNEVLDNIAYGLWGKACDSCVHHPYIPRSPKQCSAAKKL